MKRFMAVLLSIWREACRHIEIHESAATIAGILREHMPLDCLIVRSIDLQRSTVDTVAVAAFSSDPAPAAGPTPCTPTRLQRLLAWTSGGTVLRRSARGGRGELDLIIPDEVSGDVIAGPLTGPEGLAGALVLVASAGKRFDASHVEMLEALLEPFSVALDNDRRLRQLATLCEAASSDRRSLLARLGRNDLGGPIVGADAGLSRVLERVALVARSDVPVLLLGETGTGKEVVARAIHAGSQRASGPFIRVNCGAIPPELVDSQLFGHERGSFTGAVETRKGWFERADQGTLFLDEIGELPLAAQVRLLRVVQDGFIERVGGQRPVHVDVRLVAATNHDLAAMVAERQFREDLWYRINAFPIPLPPLRERVEDIAALACHFAEKAATRFGLALVMPSPDDVRLLAAYPWPGNVRELASVVDRAALLGNGQRLEVGKALGITPPQPAPRSALDWLPPSPASQDVSRPQPPLATLDGAMREHVEKALRATHGRVEGPFGAAALLNVNPHTLRARMRKLKVDWKRFRQPAGP